MGAILMVGVDFEDVVTLTCTPCFQVGLEML